MARFTGNMAWLPAASMHASVLWLVRLGIEQKLFTREQAVTVRTAVGEEADLLTVAQKFLDDGIVNDLDAMENVAGTAQVNGEQGPPEGDPFAESGPRKIKMPTRAPAAPAATAATSEPAPPPAAPVAAPVATLAPTPARAADKSSAPASKFPFDQIEALDDPSLAAAFRELLRTTAGDGASDLHLSTGARPFVRKNRALSYLSDHVLTPADTLRLNTILLSEGQKKIYLERKDYDYALALGAASRYRVNLMFHKNGASGSYRMIPAETRTLTDLGYAKHNETLMKMLSYHNGLILVTGPVGSGKTTTLASIVAHLNETRTDHIITVEDPIEVVQPAKGCNVTQREVGSHTKSFASALKGALREDPDIIVIGELRDLETIEMAISASETGHLVIGTMHTSDATTTLNRILDAFPPAQLTQIRSSVAESLRGIVCQRLLPGKEGGLVLACEILVSNTAIQALIKDGKTSGLRNTMETGLREGMCLMDNVVFGLYQERKITGETALANISNRVLRDKIAS